MFDVKRIENVPNSHNFHQILIILQDFLVYPNIMNKHWLNMQNCEGGTRKICIFYFITLCNRYFKETAYFT